MKIKAIDDTTIKIELTAKEVDAHNLSFEKMNGRDAATRRFLLEILERIEEETNWDLESNGLAVEAYKSREGIILYLRCTQKISRFTSIRTPQKNSVTVHSNGLGVPWVFSFSTLDALCKVCLRLENQLSHLSLESKLYHAQGEYRLVFWRSGSPERQMFRLLQEYGKLCGRGDIAIAWLQEHGKELISEEAVSEMAKLG